MEAPDIDHLYYQGRHYDLRYREVVEDIPFWLRQAEKFGDPVLELACGTGRIALPLARDGFSVTGIDASESMLGLAKKKSSQEGLLIEWIKDDIRNFDLGREFSLVIFPFNTICHFLVSEDLEACLSSVRKHLSAEGRFIVDTFVPDPNRFIRDPEKRFPNYEYQDPDGKGIVKVEESNRYDHATQVNEVKLYYTFPSQEERVEILKMRMYFPQELDALLKYKGFEIESKLGDYEGNAFKSSSPKQLIICKAQV